MFRKRGASVWEGGGNANPVRERDGRVARISEAGRADVETLHCRRPDELLAVEGRIPWFYKPVSERNAEDVKGRGS